MGIDEQLATSISPKSMQAQVPWLLICHHISFSALRFINQRFREVAAAACRSQLTNQSLFILPPGRTNRVTRNEITRHTRTLCTIAVSGFQSTVEINLRHAYSAVHAAAGKINIYEPLSSEFQITTQETGHKNSVLSCNCSVPPCWLVADAAPALPLTR